MGFSCSTASSSGFPDTRQSARREMAQPVEKQQKAVPGVRGGGPGDRARALAPLQSPDTLLLAGFSFNINQSDRSRGRQVTQDSTGGHLCAMRAK